MRAAVGRRNQIDIALGDRVFGCGRPADRKFDRILILFALAGDGLVGQTVRLAELIDEVAPEITREEPLVFLAAEFIGEGDAQAWAQHSLSLEHMTQLRNRELVGIEELAIGPETHRRTGVTLTDRAHDIELGTHGPVAKTDVVFLAAATHPALELFRERIDHRHADAVQAARESVATAVEFAARVQAREDQLDAADLFLRVDVDRHAATVVAHLE